MLGLGLIQKAGKRVLGGLSALLKTLVSRATYSENKTDSDAVVEALDTAGILDDATILLTPTAWSDGILHSTKTYTGTNLLPYRTFTSSSSSLRLIDDEWVFDDTASGTLRIDVADKFTIQNNSIYKVSVTIRGASGNGAYFRLQDSTGVFTVFDYTYFDNGTTEFYTTVRRASGTDVTSTADRIIISVGGSSFTLEDIKVYEANSDFTFDRASSATRINSDGLVQDMQSITDVDLVQNGDFEELGDEEVTNGDFSSTDISMVEGAGARSVVNGELKIEENGLSFSQVQYNGLLNSSKTYKATFDITLGTGSYNIYDTVQGHVQITSSGTYTFYLSGTTRFYVGSNGVGDIWYMDNVSVKQVDPNDRWTLGTGWSIEDGVAVASNSSANATQETFTIDAAKTYKIDFTISDYGGGTFFITFGGNDNSSNFTANGNYTVYITPTNRVNNIFYLRASGFTGKIDNISVKDITFSTDVDLARINYDSNGENGHILLEPTSTNLVTYSEDFSGYNQVTGSITANSTTSPDVTTNASVFNALVGLPSFYTRFTATVGLSYAQSIFLKKGTRNWVTFVKSAGSGFAAWFDLENGVIGTVASGFSANMENYGNGWYRCSVISTATITLPYFQVVVVDDNNATTNSVEGSIYIWGAQAEALPYATSYIPTLKGSTVTRAAETLTGSGNSTLINSTEGVLYAEIAALANDGTSRAICISDGTNTHRALILYNATTNQIQAFHNDGSSPLSLFHTVSNVDDFHKVAFKYKLNDFALWIDGVEVDTSSSGGTNTANTLNQLAFENATGSSDFYGKCKALAVFDRALTDQELTDLTS